MLLLPLHDSMCYSSLEAPGLQLKFLMSLALHAEYNLTPTSMISLVLFCFVVWDFFGHYCLGFFCSGGFGFFLVGWFGVFLSLPTCFHSTVTVNCHFCSLPVTNIWKPRCWS